MRRIEFIAPVDAMRGNLSGNQELRYPTSNNKAWDAPAGKRSYANNYGTRYVGAKRSSNGRKYFSVKQRSATLINDNTRLQMALLAASSVIANIMSEDLRYQTYLSEFFEVSAAKRNGWTFKRYLQDAARQALAGKTHISFIAEGPVPVQVTEVYVVNPYSDATEPDDAFHIEDSFPKELLVKFWMQLATNPITFTVNGRQGIARVDESFFALAQSPALNVLGIEIVDNTKVKMGNGYLAFRQNGVEYGAAYMKPILENGASGVATPSYYLTDTAITPHS